MSIALVWGEQVSELITLLVISYVMHAINDIFRQ